jgi:mRNA interferase MazF
LRGDAYRLRAPRDARGREQWGERFVVVIRSDDVPLSTRVVAPAATGRRPASFRPVVVIDGVETRVMVAQMIAVDAELRLGNFAGRLSPTELAEVDTAVPAILGLDPWGG